MKSEIDRAVTSGERGSWCRAGRVASLASLLLLLGAAGCNCSNGAAEDAGDAIDEAAEEVQDEVDDATDDR